MKKNWFLLMVSSLLLLTACTVGNKQDQGNYFYDYSYSKEQSDDQFDFDGNYLPPELTVDGLKDEEEWENASTILHFGNNNNASVQFFRGERALYAFFEVEDDSLLVHSDSGGDGVNHGDSIELYLDVRNDGANRPQSDDIQINIGINGRTRLLVAGDGSWGSWGGLLDFAVRLDGTLGNTSDTDNGYTIELMIPYGQIGMERDDVIGIALGHVDKSDTNNVAGVDYQWEGLVYEGQFIDPQNPSTYLIFDGNQFYRRGNAPLTPVDFEVSVEDQNGDKVEGAMVKIATQDIALETDVSGFVQLNDILRTAPIILEISKDGFITYQRTYTLQQLANINLVHILNVVLIDATQPVYTTVEGHVENVYFGALDDVEVTFVTDNETYTATTDQQGSFSLEIEVTANILITISKDGYMSKSETLLLDDIVINGISNLGTLDLPYLSETFEFGGARGITRFVSTVGRGADGFYFNFESDMAFPNSGHIELFIDTKQSINGRDTTDYRIDFASNGNITIVNFADGQNTNVSTSGIYTLVNKTDDQVTVLGFIPYAFLNVDADEIIGFSAGVWSGSDWDGFAYEEQFVAPEYATQYIRIGADSQIYRHASNDPTTLFYGYVTSDGQPLEGANINGVLTNESGYYELRVARDETVVLTTSKGAYVTSSEIFEEIELVASLQVDFDLLPDFLSDIIGSVGQEDVKVYLQTNPDDYVLSDSEGLYTFVDIDVRTQAVIVFEKTGFHTLERTISAIDLQTTRPYVLNVTLIADNQTVDVTGYVGSAYGLLENVELTLNGHTQMTDQTGSFEFTNVPAGTQILAVSKEGFVSKEIFLSADDLADNLELSIELLKPAFGDVTSFSGKTAEFTRGHAFIQRGVEGFYVTFIGDTAWRTEGNTHEMIEFFVDTKESTTARNTTDYLFIIRANGTIQNIVNWEGGGNESIATIEVNKPDDYTIVIHIPYAFLNIESTEVFGISMGVWNEFVGDWDGWGFDGFIDPGNPDQYVRVGADNEFYKASSNT